MHSMWGAQFLVSLGRNDFLPFSSSIETQKSFVIKGEMLNISEKFYSTNKSCSVIETFLSENHNSES